MFLLGKSSTTSSKGVYPREVLLVYFNVQEFWHKGKTFSFFIKYKWQQLLLVKQLKTNSGSMCHPQQFLSGCRLQVSSAYQQWKLLCNIQAKRLELLQCVEGRVANVGNVAINISILWSYLFLRSGHSFPITPLKMPQITSWRRKLWLLNRLLFITQSLHFKVKHSCLVNYYCGTNSILHSWISIPVFSPIYIPMCVHYHHGWTGIPPYLIKREACHQTTQPALIGTGTCCYPASDLVTIRVKHVQTEWSWAVYGHSVTYKSTEYGNSLLLMKYNLKTIIVCSYKSGFTTLSH